MGVVVLRCIEKMDDQRVYNTSELFNVAMFYRVPNGNEQFNFLKYSIYGTEFDIFNRFIFRVEIFPGIECECSTTDIID